MGPSIPDRVEYTRKTCLPFLRRRYLTGEAQALVGLASMRQRYEVTAPAPGENRKVATLERVDLAGFRLMLTGAGTSKVAVTDLVPSIVSEQTPVPAHPPPDQPVNTESMVVVAANVTEAPVRKLAEVNEGIDPAAMVAVMLPSPVPLVVTVRSSVVAGPQLAAVTCGPLIEPTDAVNLVKSVPSRSAL